MSVVKNFTLKAAVLGGLIYGAHGWVNQSPEHARAVETKINHTAVYVEDKGSPMVNTARDWLGQKNQMMMQSWERADLSHKIDKAQRKVQPVGQKIKKTVNVDTVPGARAVVWLEERTSFSAIFFLLVGGAMLAVLAGSGPSSLSRGRS